MKKAIEKHQILKLLVATNIFTVITLIVFGPYEIYIANRNNFDFIFKDFYWIPLVVGVIYFVLVTILGMLLPVKVTRILIKLEFSVTLCCYVQAMFLNGKMESLLGQEVSWGIGTEIINLMIWIALVVAIFLVSVKKEKQMETGIKFVSYSISVMQLVALVSLLLTTDVLTTDDNKSGYATTEGMLSLAKDNNVVVFLLDCFDGKTADAVLEEYPDIFSEWNGFTYYPNATSVYSRTYPSVTYLLTGNMCYFDKPHQEYVEDAHENGKLIPELYRNNIDTGIYTFGSYVGECASEYISNWEFGEFNLKPYEVEKALIKMVLYRDLPYIVKKPFEYDINVINSIVKKELVGAGLSYQNFDDEWVASEFDKGITVDSSLDGSFRFFHLGACHRNLSDPVPYGVYALEIVKTYMNQMKELGIYEDATILVITDHGSSGGGDTLDMPHGTAVPLFMVKPAGSEDSQMQISETPVSHTDFIPTVLAGYGVDYDFAGTSVYDIEEDEERERYYYYSALYSDEEGEVELREYSIKGDAREASNYMFTGNAWDIQYSENRVAK